MCSVVAVQALCNHCTIYTHVYCTLQTCLYASQYKHSIWLYTFAYTCLYICHIHIYTQAASLLKDGGILFGVAPDADAICALLDSRGKIIAAELPRHTQELHLQPPAYPFSLLLRLILRSEVNGDDRPKALEFGSELLFALEDTVTQGSEARQCLRIHMTTTTTTTTVVVVVVVVVVVDDGRWTMDDG